MSQALVAQGEAAELLEAPTEKTEICWSRLVPWQRGHSGLLDEYTSVSKRLRQSLQMYSKIGIDYSPLC
jgi:hypothetical protein